MKLKYTSILASIMAIAFVAVPLTAQACGDKDRNTSESNTPEGTETSLTVEDNSFSS